MKQINVFLKVNPGREGAPMKKLASLYEELHRFFISSLGDLGIRPDEDFIVHDFFNSSVGCRATAVADIEDNDIRRFQDEIRNVIKFDPESENWGGRLSLKSLAAYSELASHLDNDEFLEIGLSEPANDSDYKNAEWRRISRLQAKKVGESISRTTTYYGAIFGKVHALFKGSKEPHFTVREAMNGILVSCYYESSQYGDVLTLLAARDSYVHVAGVICADNVSGEIRSIRCEHMEPADREVRLIGGASKLGKSGDRVD